MFTSFGLNIEDSGEMVLEKNNFFLRTYNLFSLFLTYLPLKNGFTLYLNNLEFPSHKDDSH